MDLSFWAGRRVLVTGHTGFKGGWLALWLKKLGAEVTGFSLPPEDDNGFYCVTRLTSEVESLYGDILDIDSLDNALHESQAEVVFHLAAQPLVLASYEDPASTYATNVMGTVNVLEVIRRSATVSAAVIVTSDKCYENREWDWPYREDDRLGGHDPYSNSKACCELVVDSFRKSFFSFEGCSQIASARAGNVIGGGDWSANRLVPDILKASVAGASIEIRNPSSIRPWQHVLEPICGYISLAERLCQGGGFARSWNFGPRDIDVKSVGEISSKLSSQFNVSVVQPPNTQEQHEATLLKLDSSLATCKLGWQPVWSIDDALNKIVEWHLCWLAGDDMQEVACHQIDSYVAALQSLQNSDR